MSVELLDVIGVTAPAQHVEVADNAIGTRHAMSIAARKTPSVAREGNVQRTLRLVCWEHQRNTS